MTAVNLIFSIGMVLHFAFAPVEASETVLPHREPAIVRTYRGGDVQLRLGVNRPSITTAEEFQLELLVDAPGDSQVFFPDLGKRLGDFSVTRCKETHGGGNQAHKGAATMMCLLEPFLPGEYRIPPLEVAIWTASSTSALKMTTEALSLSVYSLLDSYPQGKPLNPIFGPVEIRDSFRISMVTWTGLALLIAGVVSWVIFLRHGKRGRIRSLPGPSPGERALLELEQVRCGNLEAPGQDPGPGERAAAVLCQYVENRFALDTSTLTTSELVEAVRAKGIVSRDGLELLEKLLDLGDALKYGAHTTSDTDLEELIRVGKEFIQSEGDRVSAFEAGDG